MCGLFGFSRSTDVTDLMTPSLALMMSMRGRDSWGVTDGEHIFKVPKDITESFVYTGYDAPLYHTRGASVGVVSERNAHPFRVESPTKVVIGAHNGHISNHADLKEKYKRKECEVDSEQIFHHLAFGEDLAEIGGWGAVVWYEYPPGRPKERVRYFSRFNNEALHFAKMETGEVVFTSTRESIKTAALFANVKIQHFYETEPKKRYWIESTADEDKLVVGKEEMNWASNIYHKPTPQYVGGYGSSFVASGRVNKYKKGICAIPNCNTCIADDMLICEYHYGQLAADMYGDAYAGAY